MIGICSSNLKTLKNKNSKNLYMRVPVVCGWDFSFAQLHSSTKTFGRSNQFIPPKNEYNGCIRIFKNKIVFI